jgi:thiamine pyrophosphate-dependent acetolactate synthase large subunit-like protein
MELLTAQKLGLNPIVIVINNGSFTSLRSMAHHQADFVKIPSFDYAQFANLIGGIGFVVETGPQLQQALKSAHDHEALSIIEVRLEPEDVSPGLQRMSDLFAKTLKG